MTKIRYENTAQILKIIAHPCRLRILELLRKGEMQVTQVQKHVHCKQSVTSQHLIKMKNKGILKACRRGNAMFYSIADFEVFKILQYLMTCPQLQRRNKCLKN